MNWKTYFATLVLISAVVLGLLWFSGSDDDRVPEDEPETEALAGGTGDRPSQRPFRRERAFRPSDRADNGGDRDRPARRTNGDPVAAADDVSGTTTAQSNDQPQGSNGDPLDPPPAVDMGSDEDMRPWNDPVNRRVLGDKRWMAPVDEEEEARIDEIFEKARAARHDPGLSRSDRLTSIDVAQKVVDACFDELDRRSPGIEGRLIVRWTSGAKEGQGWIRDPEIMVNYRLEDDQFEACILDGLPRQTFPAQDGDPVTVEYPFFYDGAF